MNTVETAIIMQKPNEEFIRWLTQEMDKRGWNNSELARKAGLRSPSTVQQVVTGGRNPGVEFCLGVARAFREPPELVFRRAGLLPDREGIEDELFERFRAYIEALSPERREELFHYVMFLHQLEMDREANARDDEESGPEKPTT